jgi:hypothetical protein
VRRPRSATVPRMAVLIAEDLLLLLLDDHRGDLAVRDAGGPPTGSVLAGEAVLGGAVLLELDLAGAVQLRGTPGGHEVVVTPRAFEPGGVTGDPVLRAAVQRVDEAPRDPVGLVARLGAGLPAALAGRLADGGPLTAVAGPVPGTFRWPAADVSRESGVRRALWSVLVEGAAPDRRTRALAALLAAVGLAEDVLPPGPVPAPEVARRAASLADGCWPAAALQQATLRLRAQQGTGDVPAAVPVPAPRRTTGAQEVVGGLLGVFAVSLAAGVVTGLAAGLAEGAARRAAD